MSLRFHPYDQTEQDDIPNIVVDGSPNRATVLTLTHWPGIAQPPGLGADLSAQMAFRYLEDRPDHEPAEAVTNNHFDQDGLVGIHALVDPEGSAANRELLVDVAAAGDFATYRHRAAARASMAIWSFANPERSPLGAALDGPYPEVCARLYEHCLPLVLPLVLETDRFRDLWEDEDRDLAAAERALADGTVTIRTVADVDLAVVDIGVDLGLKGGHRFAADHAELIHPMAVNNNTDACRVLLRRGRDYLYLDRYETWVQYRSRDLPQRVDLAPLAARLTGMETGATTWSASAPSALSPRLGPDGPSSLSNDDVERTLIDHLASAAPAWDPAPDS